MSTENGSLSPNARLADEIANSLLEQGLIPSESFEEVRRRIADGSASAADWCSWVTRPATASATVPSNG